MTSTFTKILTIILGLGLLTFGLNKFIGFLPVSELPPSAAEFMTSLRATGYVLYFLGILEIFIGVLLIFKRWVPFALLVLAPISINILLFHLFLDNPDIIRAIIVFAINVVLIYKYWKSYKPLFQH